MSTTADLVTTLKKELKAAQMTYADLARELGMAESSVKRMLAKGDMPLSRIDAICRALAPSFLERMQRVAQDFQQQHQADQKLKDADRKGYTLLLAMRDWEFAAFAPMRR